MNQNRALLIIDAQNNMFAEDASVFEGKQLLQRISRLILQARRSHLPIVYVQNNGQAGDPDLPGTPGWQIHPAVAPQAGDIIIQKHTPDAFHETNLRGELEARHIQHVIVAGMQTEMCIAATCQRAHELGYEVTLVKDAHSTFDDGDFTAAQIIAQHNDTLSTVATVKETKEIVFE